jgi:hypothetical protein
MKTAHVPTAIWGHWVTAIMFVAMLAVTVISGIRATRRSSWKETVCKEKGI